MDLQDFTNSQMVEINIKEFISGTSIPVDVYLKLAEDKYVLLAKKGDQSQLHGLNVIKNNAVDKVFVKKEDYTSFTNNTVNIVKIVNQSSKFKTSHKTKFIRSATNAVFTQISNFGASEEAIAQAKDIAISSLDMIEPNVTIAEILKGLQQGNVLNQSVAVSAFSVMVAQQLGWQSRITLEKLSMGALLAEVGLKELPVELIEKPRSEMTHDEITLYEEHPFRGLRLLETAGNIPDDVKSVVYEHHENAMGMGYPRKLRDLRMNPLAKVVALVTQFCELIVEMPANPDPWAPVEAINYIENVMGQPFNKEAYKALQKLVEIDLSTKKSS
ncbi:MAG: HD-GYP domain-containing protein [Bdellovibrionales bacterium]